MNVQPDDMWFALAFLTVLVIGVAINAALIARDDAAWIRTETDLDRPDACHFCAGTGRMFETAEAARGGELITRYMPCPCCNGSRVETEPKAA